MFTEAYKQLKIAFVLLLLLSLLTGLIYPFLVTGLAQVFFPWQANGSLITQNGKVIGSQLLGQAFSQDKYFWGRPSATTPYPYNAENSSGSKLGPSNPALLSAVKARVEKLQKANPPSPDKLKAAWVPIDLVTASASGLDPDISPLAAFYQVARVAKARQLPAATIQDLIIASIKPRVLGLLGEPRVNVLQLNLALDQLSSHPT